MIEENQEETLNEDEQNMGAHDQEDDEDRDYQDNSFVPQNQYANNQISTMSKMSNGTADMMRTRDPHIRAAL